MFSDEVISSTVYLKENESLVVMLSQLLQHSVLNKQKKVRSMSQKNQEVFFGFRNNTLWRKKKCI